MKLKTLFSVALILLSAQVLSAQSKHTSSRLAFEQWKHGKIVSPEKQEQEFLYFAASAKKAARNSAVINFGIAGFKRKFDVSITPLKYEQTADGKWIETELPLAGKLQKVSAQERAGDFAEPSMKIRLVPEANAVKLSLRFDGEAKAKTIILKLTGISATGLLTSL